ncbi:hypothetical protein TVAG_474480 [Trichomonas vaginalis G3]|uniref:Thioredoxin domain-containing protein n=1 Tax=Trichomonas vaginalis (strain ATCC PRA-98 / G3) TaxID=412133 RepID=A2ESY4_TRIV3|nr:hypothetical protein TVAGG3_0191690 [Trichomonas vaginalis G3]EAY04242.1 hypothetical protein TVAG_474480 [Trichomonas vaginalis G3]KAI5550017.1 hypothetical protein TVAGG3_0191690 [Trichomonas vaginalis G3]|eukprot:XP_001316465.1 hypothetical protein [Trichomonas vaginalis G3]
MFFSIALRATNKLANLDKPEYSSLPRIIFPYYPRMTQQIKAFKHFEKRTQDNETFVTVSVNCLEERTFCSRYKLQAGQISVSLHDHEHPVKISRKIDAENLNEISQIVSNHGYLTIDTPEQITAITQNKPLFMLVSRANAGDLEEKKPSFEKLAISNIDSGCIFAFVTSPYLYEKYAHYPYISFVFIHHDGKFTSYRGDFSIESLQTFVSHHAQPFMGHPVATDATKIVAVGNDAYFKQISEKLDKIDFYVPSSYLNTTNIMKAVPYLCNGKYQCLGIFRPNQFKLVLINETDIASADIRISQFDSLWKEVPFAEKFKIRAAICFLFYRIQLFIVCGILSVVSLFFFVWMVDSSRIIEFID